MCKWKHCFTNHHIFFQISGLADLTLWSKIDMKDCILFDTAETRRDKLILSFSSQMGVPSLFLYKFTFLG